jgi:hypothetical protein
MASIFSEIADSARVIKTLMVTAISDATADEGACACEAARHLAGSIGLLAQRATELCGHGINQCSPDDWVHSPKLAEAMKALMSAQEAAA